MEIELCCFGVLLEFLEMACVYEGGILSEAFGLKEENQKITYDCSIEAALFPAHHRDPELRLIASEIV